MLVGAASGPDGRRGGVRQNTAPRRRLDWPGQDSNLDDIKGLELGATARADGLFGPLRCAELPSEVRDSGHGWGHPFDRLPSRAVGMAAVNRGLGSVVAEVRTGRRFSLAVISLALD